MADKTQVFRYGVQQFANNWDNYGGTFECAVSANVAWKTVEQTITMPESVSDTGLFFNLAVEEFSGQKICFRNLKLEEVSSTTVENLMKDITIGDDIFKNDSVGTVTKISDGNFKLEITNAGTTTDGNAIMIQTDVFALDEGSDYTFSMNVASNQVWFAGCQLLDTTGTWVAYASASHWDNVSSNKKEIKWNFKAGTGCVLQMMLGNKANYSIDGDKLIIDISDIKLVKNN